MMINSEDNQHNKSAKLSFRTEGNTIHVSYRANGEPSPKDSLLYLVMPGDGFTKLCTSKRKALKPLVRVARTWANAYKSYQGSTKSRNVLLEGKYIVLALRAHSGTDFNTMRIEVERYFHSCPFFAGAAHWLAGHPKKHRVILGCRKNKHSYIEVNDLASQEIEGRFDWLGRVIHSPETIRLDEIINHLQTQKTEHPDPEKNSSFLKMYGECQSTPDVKLDNGKIQLLTAEIERAGTGEKYASWNIVLTHLSLTRHINPVRSNSPARQHKI